MPGPKYVKEFSFGGETGYTGSAGQTMVKGYSRGGKACSPKKFAVGGYAKGGKAHPDVAEDKKLIKKVVKPEAIKPGMKTGGKVKEAPAMGALSALVRRPAPKSKMPMVGREPIIRK